MPKAKGMTSLEIAIIVAIVLVIAIAVGWYLYTTFTSSITGQARLSVISADYYVSDDSNELKLKVMNPGPLEKVKIQVVELAGKSCDTPNPDTIDMQDGVVEVTATCDVTAQPGQQIQGRVVTTAGTSFAFTAAVR